MRKILIATHGKMAQGVVSSIKIILGNSDNISYINAYIEESNLKEDLNKYFKNIEDAEVIVFTDLYGGSVNTALIKYIKRANTHLITGFNLALLLEISLIPKDIDNIQEKIRECIKSCSSQMYYINDKINEICSDDFE